MFSTLTGLTWSFATPSSLDQHTVREIEAFDAKHTLRAPGSFQHRLADEDRVWWVRDRAGLAGFGTVRTVPLTADGRRVGLFTSFTALDPRVRGRGIVALVGLRSYLHVRLHHPTAKLYWVFGASTYKSYRLLPTAFGEYWPRVDAPIPDLERAMLARVAREVGYTRYDPRTCVVRRKTFSRYLEGVLTPEEPLPSSPGADAYARLNPGQAQGDMLMCLCPLSTQNLLTAFRRTRRRSRRG